MSAIDLRINYESKEARIQERWENREYPDETNSCFVTGNRCSKTGGFSVWICVDLATGKAIPVKAATDDSRHQFFPIGLFPMWERRLTREYWLSWDEMAG